MNTTAITGLTIAGIASLAFAFVVVLVVVVLIRKGSKEIEKMYDSMVQTAEVYIRRWGHEPLPRGPKEKSSHYVPRLHDQWEKILNDEGQKRGLA